ncbi:uncharacterized protein [Watersipora subatra]|uniref:uncharacterized protein n=1 Tax=Watersipora subatra TaxID=2589382 RepID=UPI00355C8591
MKLLVLLALALVGVVYSQVEVPLGALTAVRNGGMQTINDLITADNQRLVNAVEAFKPINSSCNAQLNTAIPRCRTCVESKCEARAKLVCRPEKWQVILGKSIRLFTKEIPRLFTDTIPDVVVDKIGGGIIDVSKDIGDFLKDKIGKGIVRIGEVAVHGVVDIGKGLGDGIVDFGKKITDGVLDVGKSIGHGIGKAFDGIKNVGHKLKDLGHGIGKTFKKIFGKRELMSHEEYVITRRAGEPGCGEFESNAEQACQFYLQQSYCSDCGFSAEKMCPGYKAAIDEIAAANAQRKWMTTLAKHNYDIVKMSFNPAAMSATGGFNNVVVSVNIFGKDLQFTLQEAINPYIPTTSGPIIAKRALEEYKKA